MPIIDINKALKEHSEDEIADFTVMVIHQILANMTFLTFVYWFLYHGCIGISESLLLQSEELSKIQLIFHTQSMTDRKQSL